MAVVDTDVGSGDGDGASSAGATIDMADADSPAARESGRCREPVGGRCGCAACELRVDVELDGDMVGGDGHGETEREVGSAIDDDDAERGGGGCGVRPPGDGG